MNWTITLNVFRLSPTIADSVHIAGATRRDSFVASDLAV